jgi:hypothetical protein
MGLRSFVLYAIAGSTLVGWLGWPAAEPAQGVVDIGGPCSLATRQWAETWRRAPTRERAVARVSVLCQADGRTYAATLVYSRSAQGPRFVSWRPVTTFFGTLSPHGGERVAVFDQTGRLVEYATVDRQAERVEFYSTASRLTGHGRLDTSSGRVERFSIEGYREGSLLLPIPPGMDDDD